MLEMLAQIQIQRTGVAAGLLVVWLIVCLGGLVLFIFVWGTIFKRAGYSFAMVLLMLVPIVNFIWLLIFAFSKWPVQKELEYYKQQTGQPPV